jgi:acetate kinase
MSGTGPGAAEAPADVLVVNAGSRSLKLSRVAPDDRAQTVATLDACDATGLAGVGHRIVHGGSRFREPVIVTDAVRRAIGAIADLAPLQSEPALAALDAARAALDVPHVAVFDTAFHSTIPPVAATYAVPVRWRDEWGIRRYGFHGSSVRWVAEQVPVGKLVVCHLGGGCSVTAVRDGRSVDTTMGFGPLDGVPMATRSGSLDPGILIHVMRHHGLSVDTVDHALHHESGLFGLGGTDELGELMGTLAADVYIYRIAGAVAAMAVALDGIDVLAFTGGVGENVPAVRERVTTLLACLAPFVTRVVPAREDLIIAREVRLLLGVTRAVASED